MKTCEFAMLGSKKRTFFIKVIRDETGKRIDTHFLKDGLWVDWRWDALFLVIPWLLKRGFYEELPNEVLAKKLGQLYDEKKMTFEVVRMAIKGMK